MLQTRLALGLLAAIAFVATAANGGDTGSKPEAAKEAPLKKSAPSTAANVSVTPAAGVTQARNSQRARAGRMLDLDHLAGDIGKEEKVARERQMSGDRQSRILADDLFLGAAGPKKTGKSVGAASKKAKKMSISGFIPIMSLEQAAGASGKGLLGGGDDDEEESSETSDEEQQPASGHQLLSNYGSTTSLGHASFVPQPQPSQHQAQHLGPQSLGPQEAERAGRRAQQHADGLSPYGLLQGPQRYPLRPQPAQLEQHQDCICVPFYQCRNGYLSESQLGRGQLSQLMPQPGNHLHNHQQQQLFSGGQVPRALSAAASSTSQQDLYNSLLQQQQQQVAPIQDPQQALNNDFIYEQLKKTIESENLEQAAAANQPLVDERSAGGAAGNGSGSGAADVLARNILNPLMGLRGAQRSCGLMRTCCRLPTGHQLPQFAGLQPPNPQPAFQQLRPLRQQRPLQPVSLQQLAAAPVRSQRPPVTSTLVESGLLGGGAGGPFNPSQQYPPPGSFMQGRCGLRPTLGISGRVQNQQGQATGESSADFGEFPSHAALLKRLPSGSGDSLFICSAVLVSSQWLVTAAHCVRRLQLDELKVRLGEWDVSRDDEFYPFLESNVRQIIVHPDFQASSLINDIAMLRLESPLDAQQMPHITPACLATPDEVFDNQRCWLTGWGKDAFGAQGTFQSVLKKVDLPVMGRRQCEQALRHHTKLGPHFRLHNSAVCAGGERGKDACEGDGGSGLYCTEPQSGLVKVAGLVSWGVGCGLVGVPGVYTNLAKFYHWIEQVAAASGEESLYSDRNAAQSLSNGLSADAFKNIISERSNGALAPQLNGTAPATGVTSPPPPPFAAAGRATNNETLTATGSVEEVEARTG